MQELSTRNDQVKRRELERAYIDLSSTKVQMVLGAVLIFLSCLLAYRKTFAVGFLLDDFLHINYIAAVFQGHPEGFLANFTSNWGDSDLMKSYRPIISLTLFIDYLCYHTRAAGYHLTNFFFFYADCILTSLITLELTGRLKSRLAAIAALWAGLLFSVYPLHGESVAWIIGRVDTVATFFYLGSVELFLRARLTGSQKYDRLSLASFLLALAGKEIAVSLPLVIFLAAFLPQSILAIGQNTGKKKNLFRRALEQSLPYWLLLITFALLRHFLLGTTIGGYGADSPLSVLSGLRNFLDKASLIKIFVPVSEEYNSVSSMSLFAMAPVAAIAGIYLVRSLLDREKGRGLAPTLQGFAVCILLAAWLVVAALPAFQIWHIYPNLVGSRLFFLSSVPLCILLSQMALPALDAFGKKEAKLWTALGLIGLSALYLSWSNMLAVNLRAFREAGLRMQVFKQILTQRLAYDEKRRILLLNLPQDYKGAGMVGRRLYLDIMLRQPFVGRDLSKQVTCLDSFSQGGTSYIQTDKLADVLKTCDEVLYFDNDSASFQNSSTAIKPDFKDEKLSFNPQSKALIEKMIKGTPVLDGESWRQAPDTSRVDLCKDKIVLMPAPNSAGKKEKLTMHLPWPVALSLNPNGPLLVIELAKKINVDLVDLIVEDKDGHEIERLPVFARGNKILAYAGALKACVRQPVKLAIEFTLPEEGISLREISLSHNETIKPDKDGNLQNLPGEETETVEVEEGNER